MVDWTDIVARHGPAVWRTVYRLLGEQADALDCYQETFLQAYETAVDRSIRHWPAFLASLATRRAIDHLRRKVRLRNRFTPLETASEPVDGSETAVEFVAGEERLDQVRRLLADLPEKQAEVFWLSAVEEMSHLEIGGHMGLSQAEVRVSLHRARRRLQALLGPACPERRPQ